MNKPVIAKKTLRILNVGGALITAFFLYILIYGFSEAADYKTLASLMEKSLACLVVLLAVALGVNYREINKR